MIRSEREGNDNKGWTQRRQQLEGKRKKGEEQTRLKENEFFFIDGQLKFPVKIELIYRQIITLRASIQKEKVNGSSSKSINVKGIFDNHDIFKLHFISNILYS